jgi:hypothetical protein
MAIRTDGSDQDNPRFHRAATVGILIVALTTVTIGLLARGVTVQTPWGPGFDMRIVCDGFPIGGYVYLAWDKDAHIDKLPLGPCRGVLTRW